MNWIEINDTGNTDELKRESGLNPGKFYVIFKHSTRCATSRMAKILFESEWSVPQPAYLVNVIESRPASNAIASDYHIRHESPQVLVIRNGICIYHHSHSMINAVEVQKIVNSESPV